jgi:hypothetical protein
MPLRNKFRSPKSEGRKKAEIRSPNTFAFVAQLPTPWLSHIDNRSTILRLPLEEGRDGDLIAHWHHTLKCLRISAFGLLSDFGLRPSGFIPEES